MQLNKPKGEAAASLQPFENPRNIQLGKEPVTIKAGMLILVSDSPEEIGVSESTQQLSSLDNNDLQAPLSIISCLKKFSQQDKPSCSESKPVATADDYSVLNAQIGNMKLKKILQIADKVRSDDSV